MEEGTSAALDFSIISILPLRRTPSIRAVCAAFVPSALNAISKPPFVARWNASTRLGRIAAEVVVKNTKFPHFLCFNNAYLVHGHIRCVCLFPQFTNQPSYEAATHDRHSAVQLNARAVYRMICHHKRVDQTSPTSKPCPVENTHRMPCPHGLPHTRESDVVDDVDLSVQMLLPCLTHITFFTVQIHSEADPVVLLKLAVVGIGDNAAEFIVHVKIAVLIPAALMDFHIYTSLPHMQKGSLESSCWGCILPACS